MKKALSYITVATATLIIGTLAILIWCSNDFDILTLPIQVELAENRTNKLPEGLKAFADIDAESFELSQKPCTDDKKNLYCGLFGLDKDPTGYVIINVDYTKDRNYVYFRGAIAKPQNQEDLTLDPESFSVINDSYVKDKNGIYHYDQKLIFVRIEGNVDLESFTIINDRYRDIYAKDKNHVYHLDSYPDNKTEKERIFFKIVQGANPETFKMMTESGIHTADNLHVFYKGQLIIDADVDSFSAITRTFSKDTNTAYYRGKKIINSDGKTFKLENFIPIKNHYFGSDPDTHTARDKNHVYFKGSMIKDMDPDKTTALGCGYYSDGEKMILIPNLERNESLSHQLVQIQMPPNSDLMKQAHAFQYYNERGPKTVHNYAEKIKKFFTSNHKEAKNHKNYKQNLVEFFNSLNRLPATDKKILQAQNGVYELPNVNPKSLTINVGRSWDMRYSHFYGCFASDKNAIYYLEFMEDDKD